MDSYIINTADLQITEFDFIIRLLVTIGIGLLIGLEREYEALTKKEAIFAGIRTFVLLTLTGFIGAALNILMSPWIFAVIIVAVMALTAISYWITANRGDIGGTSELTGLLALLLGAMCFLGYTEVSIMIMVIMLVLLSSKVKLMNVVGQITQDEIYALVRFVVVALLIFPFLPDKTLDSFGVINPRDIGWVIVLISGLGLVGYILIRILGTGRGILLTGILGGLVSSTAVTWVFSKKSKEYPELSDRCATAILAASTIMVLRVLVWVFIFNSKLLQGLLIPISIIILAAMGATLYYYFKRQRMKDIQAAIPPGKPLNLNQAIFFGLIYMVILFVVAYANSVFGQRGIYITSGLAGLTDIDAITISMSKLSATTIPFLTAQNAILLAIVSNTIVKIGISLWAGSRELKKYILIGYGLIFLAALVAFAALNL